MHIEWTNDLAVDNPKIDAQHQELFRRINQLFEACAEGKGTAMVSQTIQYLESYVVEHFGMEEALMVESHYPGFAEHQKLHRNFIASFNELKQQINPKGPGVNTVILVNRMVVEWLNQHIRNVDKRFGQYLRAQK